VLRTCLLINVLVSSYCSSRTQMFSILISGIPRSLAAQADKYGKVWHSWKSKKRRMPRLDTSHDECHHSVTIGQLRVNEILAFETWLI
jgi:hypothetical protein